MVVKLEIFLYKYIYFNKILKEVIRYKRLLYPMTALKVPVFIDSIPIDTLSRS